MAKVYDGSSKPAHIIDIPISLFQKAGVKYVRIPTEDQTSFKEFPIPSVTRKQGLLTLVVKLTFFGCFFAGRKCGPTLLIAFVTYLYISGFFAVLIVFGSSMRALYNICDTLLYHPEQPDTSRSQVILPSAFNLPFEEVTVKTADEVRLHGYLIKQSVNLESSPTVLYLHGNAGNIGHRLGHAQGLYHSCKVNILLLEYRGYGKSEGTPSEFGLYQDAMAGIEFLLGHPSLDKTRIVLFGRSLGGAVALYLASHIKYSRKVAATIVENTFTSIPALAKVIIPYKAIKYVPRFFYKNVFASEDRIAKINSPILFVSGLADTLIPPAMMNTLHNKCSSQFKRLATFESGTHNQTWQCKGYFKILKEFVESVKTITSSLGPEQTIWPEDCQSIHIPADIV